MGNKTAKKIIKNLEGQVKDMEEYGSEMVAASWEMEYGCILSGNDVKILLEELKK